MRHVWNVGLWLTCLAGALALGPSQAAGQVVIEERVELTAPDTSKTGAAKKNASTEEPPFVYVWVRPMRGFTASPFSSPDNEAVPPRYLH